MSEKLPEKAELEQLRTEAKDLLQGARAGDHRALAAFTRFGRAPSLHDAQWLIAERYGFAGWTALKTAVERQLALQDPARELAEAVRTDSLARTTSVLAARPELRARLNEALPGEAFGATALHVAVRRKQIPIIEALVAAGADPNQRSHWWAGGFSLLEECDPTLLLFLLQLGAKVDAHAAARHGLLGDLRRQIASDPDVVKAPGGDGKTPLHWAASTAVVDLLLASGAAIDAVDVDHESTAAQHLLGDKKEVVRHLVLHGCRTDLLMASAIGDVALARKHLSQNPEAIRMSVSPRWFPMSNPKAGGSIYIWTLGWHTTPHDLARKNKDEAMLALLMASSPPIVQLARACEWGDQALLKKLGTSSGTPSLPEDRTRIVDAAQRNDLDAVGLLLEYGWSPQSVNTDGATALHWACWHGNAPMVGRLLAAKAPVEPKDFHFGHTPSGWTLHGSTHSWHRMSGDYPRVVRLLRAAGATFKPTGEELEPLAESLVQALAS